MKKKITLLLLEITAVLVLVTLLACLGIDRYNKVFNAHPVYVVEFDDVDGLFVGCPVRFAGLHVGHVIKEEVKNDKILVSFKITSKDMKIPKGSSVGIEFTGLVGSKSLEIRPPGINTANETAIIGKEPLRISSIIEIQNMMSEVLYEISDNTASFLSKNKESLDTNLHKAGDSIKETSVLIQNSGKAIEETRVTVVKKAKELKELSDNASTSLTNVNEALKDVADGKDAQESIKKVKETTDKITKLVEKQEVEKKISDLSKNIEGFNKNVKQMNSELNRIKARETGYLKEFSTSVKTTAEKLESFANSLETKKPQKSSPNSDKKL